MCSHRAPPAPMVPSKREMEDSPVRRPLKAADLTQSPPHRRVPAPATTATTSAAPAPAAASTTNPAASLGALGLDLLGSVAAFLHPLDLARVGLCSRGLLGDTEASAALLLKRMPAAKTAAMASSSTATPVNASTSLPRGARYQYLSAFEVAAAGGEKLKAALRTIYENGSSSRRHTTTTTPTTTTTTKLVMHIATTVAGSSTGKPLASTPSSPTSEEINLSGAHVGDEGVAHLALALRVSKAHRVRLLNLSRCDISDQGARALLHALKDHAEVDTLCLGQNRIGSPGAQCIAKFLASSPPRLRSLSISDNPITDEGANDIVGALPACASLATLSMRCQGVSSQVREEVRMTWGGRGGNSVFGLYI